MLAQNKENNRWNTGFFTGMEVQSLGIEPLDTREPDKAAVRPGLPAPGITLGVLAQRQIWKGLAFQPEMCLSYQVNQVDFKALGTQSYRFMDLELPLHLVFKDWRQHVGPVRGCIVFGPRMGWNMAKNPSDKIGFVRERYGLDLGLGAEIKVRKWILQPALLYSHGLNDIHDLDQGAFDGLAGRAVRDKLALRISVVPFRRKN